MKNTTEEKSNKDLKRIKRRNFFLTSGSAILGFIGLSKIPSGLFQSGTNQNSKTSSLKISENPNSVKRKTRQGENG